MSLHCCNFFFARICLRIPNALAKIADGWPWHAQGLYPIDSMDRALRALRTFGSGCLRTRRSKIVYNSASTLSTRPSSFHLPPHHGSSTRCWHTLRIVQKSLQPNRSRNIRRRHRQSPLRQTDAQKMLTCMQIVDPSEQISPRPARKASPSTDRSILRAR